MNRVKGMPHGISDFNPMRNDNFYFIPLVEKQCYPAVLKYTSRKTVNISLRGASRRRTSLTLAMKFRQKSPVLPPELHLLLYFTLILRIGLGKG